MATYFVSGHQGAHEWARSQGLAIDFWVNHLDINAPQSGDLVVGTLPINLVAVLNARGVRYLHLSLNLPKEWRGEELTAADLHEIDTSLREFLVLEESHFSLPEVSIEDSRPLGNEEIRHIAICLGSGQQAPNYIPVALLNPDLVVIVTSQTPNILANAQRLEMVFQSEGRKTMLFPQLPSSGYRNMLIELGRLRFKLSKEFGNARYTLIVNGGTKTMSQALQKVFGDGDKGQSVYLESETDSLEFLIPLDREPIPVQPVMRLKTLMAMNNFLIKGIASEQTDFVAHVQRTQHIVNALVNYVCKASPNPVLISALNGAAGRYEEMVLAKNPIESITIHNWRSNGFNYVIDEAVRQGLITFDRQSGKLAFTSLEHAKWLQGSWLEEYTWKSLGLRFGQEVYQSVDGLLLDTAFSSNPTRNEFDVVVLYKNRMILVECKAAKMDKGSKGRDILQQLESLARHYGGVKTLPVLVSVNRLEEYDRNRAEALGILVIEGPNIRKMADIIEERLEGSLAGATLRA